VSAEPSTNDDYDDEVSELSSSTGWGEIIVVDGKR